MAQESRGGGYDLAEEKRRKKAFGSETRQSVGAQALARSKGEDPQAPRSLGDLMTPSTFARGSSDGGEQEYSKNVERNKSFLSSPETKAALMQFGISMLASAGGGGDIGSNIQNALSSVSKMGKNRQKLTKEAHEAQMDERRVRVAEAGLGLESERLELEKFKALRGEKIAPSELMKILGEAQIEESLGNHENAALLRGRAYQLSQEFSMTNGQILNPPNNMGIPNEGGVNAAAAAGGAGAAGDDLSSGPTITNIPGGKADLEAEEALSQIATAKLKDIEDGMLISASVDNIFAIAEQGGMPPDYRMVGGVGSLMQYIPILGQSSANVAANIETISSKITIGALTAMRLASPTGGALGNVSDRENKMLAATKSSLIQNQSWEQMQINLKTVQFLFDPNSIELRGQLSKRLMKGEITVDEADAAFNAMYRQAVFGKTDAEAAGATMDMSVPPTYVSPQMKEVWSVLTPDEKASLLNDEDRAKIK